MKKIILFGLGSIGRRHAGILRKDFGCRLYAFRTKGREVYPGIQNVYSWKEVEEIKPDIAVIANPTSQHIHTAIECARRGMHLFIEKPLDCDTRLLKELCRVLTRKKVSTYVAYVLRFHPVVEAIRQYVRRNHFLHMRVLASSYLPSWRPKKNYLKSYSARLKMGGGVIYDLSHEIDFAQYILGDIKRLEGRFAKRSHVTVDSEDYADILIETKKGPANIHIDFLSQITQRIIQVDFKEKSVVGDILRGTVVEYKLGKPVKKFTFDKDLNRCYVEQFRYFFANLKNRRMMNNVFEASKLLHALNNFKKAKRS